MGIRAVYDSVTKTITDSVDAVGAVASASKRLAELADNKARRYSEMVELKDQATYVGTKQKLEQELAALGIDLTGAALPPAKTK